MKSFGVNDARIGRVWFFRIASLMAIFALIAAIGALFRNGHAVPAILLLAAVPILAGLFSWSWTGALFTSLERAKSYVEGAEGGHRHEWYAFKGQRVRVVLGEKQQPWFAVNEIMFILSLKDEKHTFRHYGPHEYGMPEGASESYLSETGLRRLIKYSTHPDAGALGIWLQREVLRMLRSRMKIQGTEGAQQEE